MPLDLDYLRKHYASLSDEALLEVDRADLVEAVQQIYDLEVSSRKLVLRQPEPLDVDVNGDAADEDESEVDDRTPRAAEEPGWREEAAEVYGYSAQSATAPAPDAALDARDALEAAGIPSYLDLQEMEPEKSLTPYGTHRWRLMVPHELNLQANSVLERDVFNAEFEAGWQARLESLSDEELRAMTPQVAFFGLYDRIARVNRVYAEELARRRLK